MNLENLPESLLREVAKDILNKGRVGSFVKEAEEIYSFLEKMAEVDPRQAFLQQYNFNADDFLRDKEVSKQVDGRVGALEKQINNFYKTQGKASGLTPQMQESRDKQLANIQQMRADTIRNMSIDKTRQVAEQNPDQFKEMLNLSQQSNQALNKSYGKEIGTGLGGMVGLGLGTLMGGKMSKKHTGILQKGLSGLGGAAIGAALGKNIGSNRDEKKTGYNHEDVLMPFEIAERIQKRN